MCTEGLLVSCEIFSVLQPSQVMTVVQTLMTIMNSPWHWRSRSSAACFEVPGHPWSTDYILGCRHLFIYWSLFTWCRFLNSPYYWLPIGAGHPHSHIANKTLNYRLQNKASAWYIRLTICYSRILGFVKFSYTLRVRFLAKIHDNGRTEVCKNSTYSDVSFRRNSRIYPHKKYTDINQVHAECFCRKL